MLSAAVGVENKLSTMRRSASNFQRELREFLVNREGDVGMMNGGGGGGGGENLAGACNKWSAAGRENKADFTIDCVPRWIESRGRLNSAERWNGRNAGLWIESQWGWEIGWMRASFAER